MNGWDEIDDGIYGYVLPSTMEDKGLLAVSVSCHNRRCLEQYDRERQKLKANYIR